MNVTVDESVSAIVTVNEPGLPAPTVTEHPNPTVTVTEAGVTIRVHRGTGGGGGVTSHGDLTDLDADDHPQYQPASMSPLGGAAFVGDGDYDLTGTLPGTVYISADAVDSGYTLTFPTATADDVGRLWLVVCDGNQEGRVGITMVGVVSGADIPEGHAAIVAGFDAGGGSYAWAQVATWHASGDPTARGVTVDASAFAGNLSITDTDVQAALQTIDALSLGGASALDDLTDVTIPAPATGDLLRWSGTAWVDYADSNFAASSHTHAANDVSSGTLDIARIPTGTTSSTVAIGNDSRITGAIQGTIVDAKGDLIAASAADTPARVAVGADGQVLVADSSTSAGVGWGICHQNFAHPISGRYYDARVASYATTAALVADTVYWVPFPAPFSATVDRLALNVTVGMSSGKRLRLGLYGSTTTGQPGALITSGTVVADSAAVALVTVSQAIIPGRLYWLMAQPEANCTVTAGSNLMTAGFTSASATANSIGTESAAYSGGAPANAASTLTGTALPMPRIRVRIA